MSGRVITAYWRALTIDLQRVGSEKGVDPSLDSFKPEIMGEGSDFASCMLVLARRSLTYLLCVIRREPFD